MAFASSLTEETRNKKPGDLIKSSDWNSLASEVINLGKALHDSGSATLQGLAVLGKATVGSSDTDLLHIESVQAGGGELGIRGWAQGWNIDALAVGKHLFINREASETSNVHIGRFSKEFVVAGNGDVHAAANLTVAGDVHVKGNLSYDQALSTKGLSVEGKAIIGNSDTFLHLETVDNGGGELAIRGWSLGWNIDTLADGKHLFINRDAKETSNVHIGRNTKELVVAGNGDVHAAANLTVAGDVHVKGNLSYDQALSTKGLSVEGKAIIGNSDTFLHLETVDNGGGELAIRGWSLGWNIDTLADGKHLFINRDATESSNVYIGRNTKELVVAGDGDVHAAANLNVPNGVLSFGNRVGQHINLYGKEYGFGIQSGILYSRSADQFVWYAGGAHFDTGDIWANPHGSYAYSNLYASGWVMSLTSGGELRTRRGMNTISDARVKTGVTRVSPNESLERLLNLNVYEYEYLPEYDASTAGEKVHGFLAQEVEQVIPEAVTVDGNYLLEDGRVIESLRSIRHDRIYSEAVGAIQSLHQTLQQQMAKIEALESQLAARP